MQFSNVKKGQGAIEFMIIFGVILVFFVLFFAIIKGNHSDKNKEKIDTLLRNVALDLRDEINIAASASEGYTRNFTLPNNVLGNDYTVILTNFGDVYLTAEGYAVSYSASTINGQPVKGINQIRKEHGEVYLNS